jgi:hypothetical protein
MDGWTQNSLLELSQNQNQNQVFGGWVSLLPLLLTLHGTFAFSLLHARMDGRLFCFSKDRDGRVFFTGSVVGY